MSLFRDAYLRLGVRKQNWLRIEHLRRVCYAQQIFRRFIWRALARDAGAPTINQALGMHRYHGLARSASMGAHHSRCWASGRSRQVRRNTLTARMHFRVLMREGFAAHIRHARS